MLDKVRSVISIELDPRMAAEITKRVQGSPEQKKLQVMLGDAIKADFPPFDVGSSITRESREFADRPGLRFQYPLPNQLASRVEYPGCPQP